MDLSISFIDVIRRLNMCDATRLNTLLISCCLIRRFRDAFDLFMNMVRTIPANLSVSNGVSNYDYVV